MKDNWIIRTKRFWQDDSAIFKFRRPIRRQTSTPILSSYQYAPESRGLESAKRSASVNPAPHADDMVEPCNTLQTCLLDLSNELLEQVICFIDQDTHGYESVRNLTSLSLTCQRLRGLCIPHVFQARDMEVFDAGVLTDAETFFSKNEAIFTALKDLKILQRKGQSGEGATVPDQRTAQSLIRSLNRCERLKRIYLDPPTELTTAILHSLTQNLLHVTLDLRLTESSVLHILPQLVALFCESPIEWSLATNANPNAYELLQAVLETQRTKAICVDTMCFERQRKFPEMTGRGYSSLEELHISRGNFEEKKRAPGVLPPGSMIMQICNIMPAFTALRRLRVEGSRMTEEMLAILPLLQSIEDLSLFSTGREAFHKECNYGDELIMTPTTDMPWLQLPRLKQLDMRYVCPHFSIQQLVPRGLLGLRVEYYSPNEHFTAGDIQWLAENCPDLERLELNINIDQTSELNPRDESTAESRSETAESLLDSLRVFRRLRKLRFFPSYWRDGRFLAQPLPSIDWPVHAFQSLKKDCHDLSTLNVCISCGEYPMRLVSRLTPDKRPLTFVVEQSGYRTDGPVRLRYGFADSQEMVQKLFDQPQQQQDGGGAAPSKCSSREIVSVRPELFFDDLCDGWAFQHYEVPYHGGSIWLDTPEGQRYIEELEEEENF